MKAERGLNGLFDKANPIKIHEVSYLSRWIWVWNLYWEWQVFKSGWFLQTYKNLVKGVINERFNLLNILFTSHCTVISFIQEK